MTTRKMFAERHDRWCEVEIKLETAADGFHRLSICGSEGTCVSPARAAIMAVDYWKSFFEEDQAELGRMAIQFGKRTPEDAARFVVETDGLYHGLDVHKEAEDRVYLTESCGQICDTMAEWFPEVVPYLKWHLNDMKAGCSHQEALGWGNGFDVALTWNSATEVQKAAVMEQLKKEVDRKRKEEVEKRLVHVSSDLRYAGRVAGKLLGVGPVSSFDLDHVRCSAAKGGSSRLVRVQGCYEKRLDVKGLFEQEAVQEMPYATRFEPQVYRDSLSAPCPECGYRYGESWLRRELPPEVVAWATGEHEVADEKVGA